MAGKTKGGLRDKLRERQVRETAYLLPLVSFEEAQQRTSDLTVARQTVQAAEYLQAREDSDEVRAALEKARLTHRAAKEAVEACFHRIAFRGLTGDDFDALVQLHPPTEEQVLEAKVKVEDPPMWNGGTFIPELLERCAQDSELSAAEWKAELDGWTRAERKEIEARVLEANIRSYSTALSFV